MRLALSHLLFCITTVFICVSGSATLSALYDSFMEICWWARLVSMSVFVVAPIDIPAFGSTTMKHAVSTSSPVSPSATVTL